MPPVINKEKCKRCGFCADACPSDVFYGSDTGEFPVITYKDECWHCNACVEACPHEGAIKLRIPLPLMVLYQERPR
jgi:NAD-dependent dihydropyrimidine dehydrogenase PreA subunit